MLSFRVYSLASVLALSACCSSGPHFQRPLGTGEPWDTTYLLDLSPSSVTVEQLHERAAQLTKLLEEHSLVEGVLWPMTRTSPELALPDRYYNGADSGIFTGYHLAMAAFRYSATRTTEDLARFQDALRGVHLLTHISGTPGVICRCAFPSTRRAEFGYPSEWTDRISSGFVHVSPSDVKDPINAHFYPQSVYYTRATKDQLTGILLGLGSSIYVLDGFDHHQTLPLEHRTTIQNSLAFVREIVQDIYSHLLKYYWYIRDEHGKNDTNADYVDELIRLQLISILRAASGGTEFDDQYDELFDEAFSFNWSDLFNRFNNWMNYFAHNLRAAQCFTVWMLEQDPARRQEVVDYSRDEWWAYVSEHQSAWFAILAEVMFQQRTDWLTPLKSFCLRPSRAWSSPYYGQEQEPGFFRSLWNCTGKFVLPPHLRASTGYFFWEKTPWNIDDGLNKEGRGEQGPLGFLLPYWLSRFSAKLP